MDIRKEFEEKRYLDTVAHSTVAIIAIIALHILFPAYEITNLIILVFVGTFFPDLDHLLLYKQLKFRKFKEFLNWIIHSNRYRVGIELFHNFPVLIFTLVSLPFIYLKSLTMFIFFLAFALHLLTDASIDKLVLRSLSHWRFTSKI